MSNQLELTKEKRQTRPPLDPPAEDAPSCHANGWLKGGLGMAICCAAPLLLVAAIAFFGVSLGAIASGALSLVALLACPVGMYLMMRMMMKDKK